MEVQELINLSINARMGHWPPHLGVNTEAEKIEYLAQRLDESATEIARLEAVDDENKTLREERNYYESDAYDAKSELKKIYEQVRRFVPKLEQ